ncbi:MAG TPA: G1 family glutamic endopeptidase, partial [Candidatus Limnocylindrales bacterium]
RRAPLPRGLMLVIALVLASVAGCDLGGPTPSASPSASPSAPAAARASPAPSASAKHGPSPTVSPSASVIASPTPSAAASPPAITGATQTVCPGTRTTARRGSVTTAQSRNWAGYIVGATKGHVTCVEGTWVQPAIRCAATGQSSVAIWVGIDGSSPVGGLPDASATLAQTGTMGNCDQGAATYGAWFEFLPDLQQLVPMTVPVAAGDKIWAQVRWFGRGKFVATFINLTQRIGATQAWTLKQAPLLTAEWIVEDPAAHCAGTSCTFVTLSRFATVTLNGAVTLNSRRYALAGVPALYLRTSISRSGKTLATPSSLMSRGFSVTWKSS